LVGIGCSGFAKTEQMPERLKKSSALRSIPGIVTGHSGIVTGDSGKTPEIGHDQSESVVTFRRNQRSRSIGITGHDGPEYAPTRPRWS
jgi:hypothetical protein